jgi:transcription initiation factor TFIIB
MKLNIEHSFPSRCPECGSPKIEMDKYRGEIICADCGIVHMGNAIDMGPEWSSFQRDNGSRPERTGPASDINKMKTPEMTIISFTDKDHYGNSIPSTTRAQIYRMRRWQRRIRTYNVEKKNLIKGYHEIEIISQALEVKRPVIELAKEHYKRAAELMMVQGRGVECVALASVYIACRENGSPRSFNEIMKDYNVTRRDLIRTFRKMVRDMGIRTEHTRPMDFLERFCDRLKLNQSTRKKAEEMIEELERKAYTTGKDPAGVTASCIYISTLITGQTRTQDEISKVSRVTEVTIRKRYKEIISILELKVRNSYLERYNLAR